MIDKFVEQLKSIGLPVVITMTTPSESRVFWSDEFMRISEDKQNKILLASQATLLDTFVKVNEK